MRGGRGRVRSKRGMETRHGGIVREGEKEGRMDESDTHMYTFSDVLRARVC